jgi:hypothetical protein
VLALVFADGHGVRVVNEDVRGHEGRVIQKAAADAIALLGALHLVLRHALQLSHGAKAGEYPREFRMSGDLRLKEDVALGRIESAGDVDGHQIVNVLAQVRRDVRNGDGVHVGDEEEALVIVHVGTPVLQRSEVITQMQIA